MSEEPETIGEGAHVGGGTEFKVFEPPRKGGRKNVVGTVIYTLISLILITMIVLCVLVRVYCFGVIVSGTSMCNTLQNDDFLYAKPADRIERGDIVIINVQNYKEHDHLSGDYIVKRVIALEGDSVYAKAGVVYVKYAGEADYTPLSESYVNGYTDDFAEVRVGTGEVFFLGDNREVSLDSRRVGCYLVDDVEGIVPGWSVAIKSVTTFFHHLSEGSASPQTNTTA